MVTMGILLPRENFHGRAWNRTRDLMISSQRLWPLDHEAGHVQKCMKVYYTPRKTPNVSATHVAILRDVDFKGQLSFVMYIPEDDHMCARNM
jgi:hypothetical protein